MQCRRVHNHVLFQMQPERLLRQLPFFAPLPSMILQHVVLGVCLSLMVRNHHPFFVLTLLGRLTLPLQGGFLPTYQYVRITPAYHLNYLKLLT